MATPRELLGKIKQRTWALMIASGGEIDYRDAQRAAAQEVREAERQRKRSSAASTASPPSLEGITPANARQWLYAKLAEIAARLALSAALVDEPPPVIRKHTQDPEGNSGVSPELAPAPAAPNLSTPDKLEPSPPADQLVGGFAFGTATSELVDDREFHTSVQSPTTQNWRRSIEEADRRARSRWVG
jgi:hypothetical protein